MDSGPDGVGLVTGLVIRVALGPSPTLDLGDTARSIEIEGAAAGALVVNRDDVTVDPVGVGAVLNHPNGGSRQCLFRESASGIPDEGQGYLVAHAAAGLAACGVVVESDGVAGGGQSGAVACRVMGVGGGGASGGGAAGAAAERVVDIGQD